MKFTYVPIQNEDGTWEMVVRLTPDQRRAVEKTRRRLLNQKFDPDEMFQFGFKDWKSKLDDDVAASMMYGVNMFVNSPRTSFVLSGFNGV